MPASDPYAILGVARGAGTEEIRRAFRALAKQYHPDNPGSEPHVFARISSAYALLSDPERRAAYDRGDIDADGSARPNGRSAHSVKSKMKARFQGFGGKPRDGTKAQTPRETSTRPAETERQDNASAKAQEPPPDAFADMPAGKARVGVHTSTAEVAESALVRADPDGIHRLSLSLEELVTGAQRYLGLGEVDVVEMRLPAGLRDGQRLRVQTGGRRRDADIEIRVEPHETFRRVGHYDLEVDVPVTLYAAWTGGQVTVPTLTGTVQMTLPTPFDGARRVRLKARGLPKADGSFGDLYAKARIVLPPKHSRVGKALAKLVEKWATKDPYAAEKHRPVSNGPTNPSDA